MLANSNKSSAAATAALTMDTNKVEEIPAKEPDLSKKPKKSALKKEYIGFKTPTSIPATSLIQYRNQRPRFNATAKLDESAEETSSNSSGGESSCSSSVGESSDSDADGSETECTPRNNNQSNQNDGSLLARFQRNDSLSRFLKERPQMHELLDKNIIRPVEHQRKIEREEIEIKLDRKLSLRPSARELEQRNILHSKTQEEINKEKEETKKKCSLESSATVRPFKSCATNVSLDFMIISK